MNTIYGRKGNSVEIPKSYNQSLELTISFDNITELAYGRWTSTGFHLLKGSRISQDYKKQKNVNVKNIIKDLLNDNVLKDDSGIYYILQSDITLYSPSTAANLVYGNSRNGYTSWINCNKTLRQILNADE